MTPLIVAIISSGIALFSAIITISFKVKLDRIARSEELKQRYSNPILKSAEELYNKLNDVIRNRSRVLEYFHGLQERIAQTQTIDHVHSNPVTLYTFHLLYIFARYFANIEEIKRGFGLLQLETPKQTRALYRTLRQTVAVFFSNRLHDRIHIRVPHMKYQGKILEGMQVMMAEAMLVSNNIACKPMAFSEFCIQMTQNPEFKAAFGPLVDFLEDLTVIENVNPDPQEEFDFRWIKLVFCGYFLNRLVRHIDNANAITLLPETEEYSRTILDKNAILMENLRLFKKAYPDP